MFLYMTVYKRRSFGRCNFTAGSGQIICHLLRFRLTGGKSIKFQLFGHQLVGILKTCEHTSSELIFNIPLFQSILPTQRRNKHVMKTQG